MPGISAGARIKQFQDPAIYLVEGFSSGSLGELLLHKRYITSPVTYDNLFPDYSGIIEASKSELDALVTGPPIIDGTVLVRYDDGTTPFTYVIDQNGKRRISGDDIFDTYYFDRGRVVPIPRLILDQVPEGHLWGL